MSEDILRTIDHALADWETSDDAMRWAPDADADAAEAEAEQAAAGRWWWLRDDSEHALRPYQHGEPVPLREADGWRSIGFVTDPAVPPSAFIALHPPVQRVHLPRPYVPGVDRLRGPLSGPIDSEALRAFGERLGESARLVAEAFASLNMNPRVAEALRDFTAAAAAPAEEPEEPPEDPRARALRHQQNRNTGPASNPFARSARH